MSSLTSTILSEENPQILNVIAAFDEKEETYYRTYSNILDVMGNIGGL
jgi:hypothetical protein